MNQLSEFKYCNVSWLALRPNEPGPEFKQFIDGFRHRLLNVSNHEELGTILSEITSILPKDKLLLMRVKVSLNFDVVFPNMGFICLFFEDSTFKDVTIVDGGAIGFHKSNLNQVTFQTPEANCYFNSCNITSIGTYKIKSVENVSLFKCKLNYMAICGAEIDGLNIVNSEISTTDFKGSKLSKTLLKSNEFRNAPDFLGASIDKTVYFEGNKFLGTSREDGARYRQLRSLTLNNNDEVAALQFNGLDHKARHEDLEKGERFLSDCYSIINDYGLDMFRPVRYLLYLGLLMFGIAGWLLDANLMYLAAPSNYSSMAEALYFTLISILGPLRLFFKVDALYPTSFEANLLLLLANILSSLFWYFFIIGIRARFALKD